MDKFLMICYVSAEFGPFKGEVFRVTPDKIGIFIEAPAWIKETIMFRWLLADGSIKVAEQQITMKQGENDPMKGVAADGRAEEKSEAVEKEITEAAEVPEKLIKTRTRKTKKDDVK